jgi:hypothetical protein
MHLQTHSTTSQHHISTTIFSDIVLICMINDQSLFVLWWQERIGLVNLQTRECEGGGLYALQWIFVMDATNVIFELD